MLYNTYIKAWELLTDYKTKTTGRNKGGLCGGKDRCGSCPDRSHHDDSFPGMSLNGCRKHKAGTKHSSCPCLLQ